MYLNRSFGQRQQLTIHRGPVHGIESMMYMNVARSSLDKKQPVETDLKTNPAYSG